MTDATTRPARRSRALELVTFVLVAYLPFFLSSPGKLSSDTKQYLYTDPGRLLARAPYLWDPHVAAGTVPHQQIGYLFPMGPYYWLMDAIGVPDWIAQRVWWGTITLVAFLGARWLFTMLGTRRAGAFAGALVYGLSPYQVAFTARMSVLLLPWAGLPWLVGLTMRAVRRGGWRDPALFALVTLAVGGVNASALLLAGVAPVLWLVLELFRGREAARAALAAAARIGVLSVGVSLWFAVGLRLQGAYGLPVLQLTENLRTVSSASSPDDLLRGIGNWFFYGTDRVGYSIDQAADYVGNHFVVVASYAVPAVALLAAAALRWRHRVYFVLLVIVGIVVGVGSWPYDDPSPYGRVWKTFADDWSIGLALRNTPRVVPVVVLGLAGLLAAAVGSARARRVETIAAATVAALAFAALWPVWRHGFLSAGVERPNEVPSYWSEAAAAMQRAGNATRVLEIPGSNFATYRWGNAVEPVTPGLMDRPYLAREVLPYGTPQSVNLLDALDRRLQQGTFEPASLAPVARLFGVGTVTLRSDLAYERSGSPRPRLLFAQLTDPLAPGLRRPQTFGPALPNRAPGDLHLIDELELRTPSGAPDPPPVSLFAVQDPLPIVRAAPAERPVVLSGDGDGIVDASAAGVLDGKALVLELASLDRAQLQRALDAGADLVLTDSNRRRIESWFSSVRDSKGATERAGQTTTDPNGYDFRLDVFPGATDASRTVVEQLGGLVDATGDGGSTRPEDRPAHAFDGDLRTAWRVAAADPRGERIVLRTARPVRADRVTLTQPQDPRGNRVVTRVRLRFDHGAPVTRELGRASLSPRGQVVRFPARTVNRMEIELLDTSAPQPANAVGFAEVRLDRVRVTERVRPPVDLARRVGDAAGDHRLDVVLSRLRYEPSDHDRQDDELVLDRRVVLPDERRFTLSGTVRVNPNAADETIDSVLGTVAAGTTFSASSHLVGDLDARASRAFDGDRDTAWVPAIGAQRGQFLDASLAAPVTVNRLEVTVVADGRHSVPTRLRLEADGVVRKLALPAIADGARPGATRTVALDFPAVTGKGLRVGVDRVRRVTGVPGDNDPGHALPVAIAEVGIAGVPKPAAPADVPSSCRRDLVAVDGRPLAVRLTGSVGDARSGLALAACDGPLDARRNLRLRSQAGLDTGVDVDRVVLTSGAGADPAPIAPLGAGRDTSGATVRVDHAGSTSLDLTVRTDGRPFVLELGQSASAGWKAETSAGAIGARQVVDGYANGWLVRPTGPGAMAITLRWTPQRGVWAGLGLSALAVLACVAIVVVTSRRSGRSAVVLADAPVHVSPFWYPAGPPPSWAATVGLAAGTVVAVSVFSRPWIGLVAGAATLLVRVREARVLLTLMVPALLALSRLTDTSELAWLALALLAVDLAGSRLRARALP